MTREELIALCEKASVPQEKWSNRDSAMAQLQVGVCWALLRAGCEFRICDLESDKPCITDDQIIWIEITYQGFNYFEYGDNESLDVETCHLPTPQRLEARQGKDWY